MDSRGKCLVGSKCGSNVVGDPNLVFPHIFDIPSNSWVGVGGSSTDLHAEKPDPSEQDAPSPSEARRLCWEAGQRPRGLPLASFFSWHVNVMVERGSAYGKQRGFGVGVGFHLL